MILAPDAPEQIGLAYLDGLDLALAPAPAPPGPADRIVPYQPRVPAPGAEGFQARESEDNWNHD